MHVPPGPTLPEQLSVSLKSPALGPVNECGEMALSTKAPWPVFLTVTATGELATAMG